MKLKVDYFSRWLLFVMVMAFSNFVIAQRTITGKVTDASDGEPLIGANVLVFGTGTGTITDYDGNYTVDVPEGDVTLEFSYTGYASQKATIGASNVLDIALSAGSVLDEVVVVGYGTQTREEVTGSVASVKAEDFNQGNITSPAQLLQGKVAGLSISRPGGNPNGSFNIRMRGLSTVGSNAEPLVIVNGVPGADLNAVDPNDIESIDVLKDGSAAAIYGTRAASGVIIITTKSGKGSSGKTSIDYNGFVTIEDRANTVDMLDAAGYRSFGQGQDLGASTDWFDEITQTGISTGHTVAMSGGVGNTTYRASLGYRDVQGIAVNTGWEQLAGRLTLAQRALNDKLLVTLNVSSTTRDIEYGFAEAFRYATIYNPTAPVFNSDPTFDAYGGYNQALGSFDYYNPVALVNQNINEGNSRVLNVNIRGDYEIIDGLKAGVFYSEERGALSQGRYFSKQDLFRGAGRNGLAETQLDENKTRLFELTGTYERDFGSTGLKILAGYSYQDFDFQGTFMSAGNFVTDAFSYNRIDAALDWSLGLGNASSYRNDSRLIAFFGRVNFNIDDTYYVSASVRREGSSQFGTDSQWGVFPGVSAGVILTNLFDIPSVDNLKLRAGYGVTGNPPGQSYLSLSRIGPLASKFFFNGAFVPSYGPLSNPNPDLQWETKTDFTVGLDFNLFDYKVNGSLEFYNTITENMILAFPVPVPPNLFGSTDVNIGELQNSGLELALDIQAVQKDNFSWNPSITFNTYLKAELVSLSNEDFDFGTFRDISNLGSPGQNNTPTVRVEEGQSLGNIWGFQYEGINEAGKWIFTDVDGDGDTNEDGASDVEDRTVIGNGVPDFEFGINNSFTFGNFDLNIFFRGAVGHDLVNTFRAFYETPTNISAYNILASGTDAEFANFDDAPQFSDLFVEDASFIRLDNLTFGYSFPNTGSFSKIRLFVNAQNLLTITGYKGVDPEVRWTDTAEGDLFKLGIGIDRRNTYFTRTGVTIGVDLGF